MISLSSTVLPQPLSPMMQTVSPLRIVRSMSRSTRCWRNRMLTLRSSIRFADRGSASVGRRPLLIAALCLWPERSVHGVPAEPKDEVEEQDGDEREDERLGGRLAHPLRAGARVEPAVATDQGDRRAEEVSS